ncbi:serine hydrolase domain-containing protein [Cytophagaceae bacterium DM2B3-1]|uniref:Serine hydrolase domain-containing protein n=1 Tax=Xanthocytophaga flava TaxID=3048013 RepID=A0ABT7CPT0_9BACT|nr:serine hydrolase domain-containing protein [Xanthocytophaga flavus]MDJ1471284.1 serine hydrolase domain-containing protein [Xanthocytophaga flavus]MDJ1495717.1 serine hydrolase domain-containing protein [Xanthocytophaga flavus]
MKTYLTLFSLWSFLLIGGLSTVRAQSARRYTPEIEKRIKQVEQSLCTWMQIDGRPNWTLAERMRFYKVKGVSIAVIHNYQIEWAKGYGWADTTDKRPVSENTLFQAASISKSLNAVGCLKLVQNQQVALDKDINQYLKCWKFPYDSLAHGKVITLGNLLSHTAGLSVHGFAGYTDKEPRPSLLQVLDGLPPANSPAIRLMAEPGTTMEYSGGGTTLTQLLVEDVAQKMYAQYMQTEVLNPLGMVHSTFAQPPAVKLQHELATGYRYDGKPIGSLFHIYPEQAAAGLWTTPTDIATFVLEMQLSLQGKSSKVLSPKMTRRMLTPYLPRYDAALGTFIFMREGKEAAYFQHTGLNEGFSSVYYGSVEGGNGVVIMCNSDNFGLIRELVNSVASVYTWKDFYNPVVKKEIKVASATTDAYIGSYTWSEAPDQTITVYKQGEKLLYHNSTSRNTWEMHFTDDTTFFLYELPQNEYTFSRDANGSIDGIQGQREDQEWKLSKIK